MWYLRSKNGLEDRQKESLIQHLGAEEGMAAKENWIKGKFEIEGVITLTAYSDNDTKAYQLLKTH